eukprot:scaffold113101_cov18-Prasinocladus_malaysianus.AAC.1
MQAINSKQGVRSTSKPKERGSRNQLGCCLRGGGRAGLHGRTQKSQTTGQCGLNPSMFNTMSEDP